MQVNKKAPFAAVFISFRADRWLGFPNARDGNLACTVP
jgi:hypothetical protein